MRDKIGIESLATILKVEPQVIDEWLAGIKPEAKMQQVLISELESLMETS